VLQSDRLDGEGHPCAELFVAAQTSIPHCVADGALDLPLGGHADHLEELANRHVEAVFVHCGLLRVRRLNAILVPPTNGIRVGPGELRSLVGAGSTS
jgi:hypothetical protein